MTNRDLFLSLASDGREWTAKGVAMLLEMDDPSQATQFLMNLKARLVIEKAGVRLEKNRTYKETRWKLVKR